MSQGKESSASLLNAMRQKKATRSGREPRPNTRYHGDEGGGRGAGGGRGRGAPLLLCDIPSASGDVASQSARSESRDEETEREVESRDEGTTTQLGPKKLRVRGEASVPEERKEPSTEAEKALIRPNGRE